MLPHWSQELHKISFDTAVVLTNLLRLRYSTHSFITCVAEADISPKVLRLRCLHTHHQSFFGFEAVAPITKFAEVKMQHLFMTSVAEAEMMLYLSQKVWG